MESSFHIRGQVPRASHARAFSLNDLKSLPIWKKKVRFQALRDGQKDFLFKVIVPKPWKVGFYLLAPWETTGRWVVLSKETECGFEQARAYISGQFVFGQSPTACQILSEQKALFVGPRSLDAKCVKSYNLVVRVSSRRLVNISHVSITLAFNLVP